LARYIRHIVPTQPVFIPALLLATERMAVEEQFRFVTRGVHVNRRDRAFASLPVPMRQEMGHRQLRSPARLIQVEPVLFESSQIENAKVGTAGREFDFAEFIVLGLHLGLFRRVLELRQTGRVVIVGSWFAQVIEAGPDKLTGDKTILVLPRELPF